MLMVCLIAGGLLGALPLGPVLTIVLIWEQPFLAAPVLVGVALRCRWARSRREPGDEVADLLRMLAAELRAGRALRAALVESMSAHQDLGLAHAARLAAAGRPLAEVGALLAERGLAPAGAALAVASHTGGSAVAVFDALAGDAMDEASIDRERRELTVAARLSGAMVGGFPLVVFAYQLISGQAARLVRSGPHGAGTLVIGSSLLAAGLGAVAVLLRRARR